MGRIIGGVVAGYLAMALAVMALLSIAYLALGAGRAFQPESYDVTGLWLVVSTIVTIAAAVLGGWLAVRIGRSHRAAVYLAVVVVVLGVVLALPTLNAPPTGEVRTGDVGNMDAMMKGHQPAVISILNPVLGAIGVMVGARRRRPAPGA
jgi:hypothetical protein